MTTIYKYTNLINGKVYVGKTKYFQHRHIEHMSLARKGKNTFFCKAIRKYGMESFGREILAEVEDDLSSLVEIIFIAALKATNPLYGYNITDGGEGTLGHHHSQESKDAISLKMTDREVTDEFRKKIGRLKQGNTYNLGLKRSPDECIAIQTRMKGNKNALGAVRSVATRQRMSKAAKQREWVKRLKRGTAGL